MKHFLDKVNLTIFCVSYNKYFSLSWLGHTNLLEYYIILISLIPVTPNILVPGERLVYVLFMYCVIYIIIMLFIYKKDTKFDKTDRTGQKILKTINTS